MFFVAFFSLPVTLTAKGDSSFASWYCCWGGGAVRGFYYYDYDIPYSTLIDLARLTIREIYTYLTYLT